MKKIYSGFLVTGWDEDYTKNDLLLADDFANGLFADISDDCLNHGNYVIFRYYISDKEFDLKDLNKYIIDSYFGLADIVIEQCGCPTCGYMCILEATIGNHNIYNELCSYEGKYCIIEIDYYKNEEEFFKKHTNIH